MHFKTGFWFAAFLENQQFNLNKTKQKCNYNNKTPHIQMSCEKTQILRNGYYIPWTGICETDENLNTNKGEFVWFTLLPHTAKYSLIMSWE